MVEGSVADDVMRISSSAAAGWRRGRRRASAHADGAGAVDIAPVHVAHTASAGRFGSAVFVLPFVHRATPGVHEEIADRRRFQAQLFGYRHLHLFRRPLGFLHQQQRNQLQFTHHNWVLIFWGNCTLKMACSVRRCRSVKTRRGFFGDGCSGGGGCSSLRLHTTATANAGRTRLVLHTERNEWLKYRFLFFFPIVKYFCRPAGQYGRRPHWCIYTFIDFFSSLFWVYVSIPPGSSARFNSVPLCGAVSATKEHEKGGRRRRKKQLTWRFSRERWCVLLGMSPNCTNKNKKIYVYAQVNSTKRRWRFWNKSPATVLRDECQGGHPSWYVRIARDGLHFRVSKLDAAVSIGRTLRVPSSCNDDLALVYVTIPIAYIYIYI